MKKRSKISKKSSAKHFTKHAIKTHKKNMGPPRTIVMRGGIRF